METPLLDQLIQQKRDRNERSRQQILTRTLEWLEHHGAAHGITEVFIFGSAIRPNHFHQRSDVDIAINAIAPEHFFLSISLLSTWLEREVDLVELERCPFQHRIRDLVIRWTAQKD